MVVIVFFSINVFVFYFVFSLSLHFILFISRDFRLNESCHRHATGSQKRFSAKRADAGEYTLTYRLPSYRLLPHPRPVRSAEPGAQVRDERSAAGREGAGRGWPVYGKGTRALPRR